MQNKSISVIISVFNTEPYLYRCLESIATQTYKPLEVIVVDDGSPGPCQKITSQFNGAKYIRHPRNQGLFASRLTGVRSASGQFVSFVDADDYVNQGMYSVLMRHLERTGADVGQCGAFLEFEDGRKTDNWWFKVDNFTISGDEVCKYQFAEGRLFYIWNKLFRRELFDSIPEKYYRIDNITMHEDILFSALLFHQVNRMISVNDCFYHYIFREDAETKAVSGNIVIEQMRSSATVCDLCEEIMRQVEIKYKLDVQALRKRLARLCYENKISKLTDPDEKERVFKEFKRFFGEYALSAVEEFQNTSIIRKTYNHLFPPFSGRRYKLKNILRPVTRYRS